MKKMNSIMNFFGSTRPGANMEGSKTNWSRYVTTEHIGWLRRRVWLDQFRKLIKGMPETVEREEIQQKMDEVFVKRVMDE